MTQDERFTRLMRRWAAVEKCMETLNDKQRIAIKMTWLGNSGIAEIAKSLGETKGRAQLIKHRADAILSDMLFGCIDEEDESEVDWP